MVPPAIIAEISGSTRSSFSEVSTTVSTMGRSIESSRILAVCDRGVLAKASDTAGHGRAGYPRSLQQLQHRQRRARRSASGRSPMKIVRRLPRMSPPFVGGSAREAATADGARAATSASRVASSGPGLSTAREASWPRRPFFSASKTSPAHTRGDRLTEAQHGERVHVVAPQQHREVEVRARRRTRPTHVADDLALPDPRAPQHVLLDPAQMAVDRGVRRRAAVLDPDRVPELAVPVGEQHAAVRDGPHRRSPAAPRGRRRSAGG